MSTKQVEMSPIEDVVAAIARGEMIVMVDDEDRENEGDLIMAAQFATAEKIAFIVRHTSGVVVAPLSLSHHRGPIASSSSEHVEVVSPPQAPTPPTKQLPQPPLAVLLSSLSSTPLS